LHEITDQSTVRVHAPARTQEERGSMWTPRRVLVLAIAYAAALLFTIFTFGFYISPDRYFLILLVPALALGVGRRYVLDFLPFVALIVVYEMARGWGWVFNRDVLHRHPYYEPMIMFDKFIAFGRTPTQWLQRWFWDGHIGTADQLVALLDHAHFFVPPTLLFIIWLERREIFYRSAGALLIAAFAAAIVFVLFPAAPPWYANHHHHLAHVVSINSIQASASSLPHGGSWLEKQIPSNSVAAMPSLHAGFATLTWLIARNWRRMAGRIFLVYPLAMFFTVVYLGDHYVLDIIAGIAVALGAWYVSGRLFSPAGRLRRLAGPFRAPLDNARSFGGAVP
jgi:membrane-associated phospholipid phosphatase